MRSGMIASAQRMPRAIALTLAVVFLCGAGVGAYYLYLWVTCGLAMGGYIWDETRYAPGYTQDRFDRVKPGWTKKEVQSLLGSPLVKEELIIYRGERGRQTVWKYSVKGPLGGHVRRIYFYKEKVESIEAKWVAG